MIILISLIILLAIGIYMSGKESIEILGIIISVLTGIYLILHIILWSVASYSYNQFVVKREAFIETLQEARKNNNSLELAAITKDISQWNQDLAEAKYNLTVFLIKDYTDKRTQNLKPIY